MYSLKISDKFDFSSFQRCALMGKTINSGFYIEVEISKNKWVFRLGEEAIHNMKLSRSFEDLETHIDISYLLTNCPDFIKYPYRLFEDIYFAVSHYY